MLERSSAHMLRCNFAFPAANLVSDSVKMVRICQPESGTGALQTAAKHPKADVVVSNKVL